MSQQYAKDQPAGFTNRVERVALAGAGGRVGTHLVEELLKTGKHTVTVLVRPGSTSKFPEGVKSIPIDYDDEESLLSALKGQEFLAITKSTRAPEEHQTKLIKAAINAGVRYIMPNGYGVDIYNRKLTEEDMIGPSIYDNCMMIQNSGVSSYVIMICGHWYEWSLGLGEPCFGIDIKTKKAIFFDDGKTMTNISTWRNCGWGLANLLSLKELPEDANDKSATVSQWKNKGLYISSFRISQRDMLDSIHRVTGSTDKDWEITYEKTPQRYQKAVSDMKKSGGQDIASYCRSMYTRIFFQNGDGDFETSHGLDNSVLGLPKDNLDEATKRTVDMVESGWNPFASS